jgi:hypothetical protein
MSLLLLAPQGQSLCQLRGIDSKGDFPALFVWVGKFVRQELPLWANLPRADRCGRNKNGAPQGPKKFSVYWYDYRKRESTVPGAWLAIDRA